MQPFPPASKKPLLPSFASFPVGYEIIRMQLEPHLPEEEFVFSFSGLDARFQRAPGFNTPAIFSLTYSSGLQKHGHWHLYARAIPRTEKAKARETILENGFRLLIDFLKMSRPPLWKTLAFGRELVWHIDKQELAVEDWNQLDVKKA